MDLFGKSEGRRQLGSPSRRWKDNIKMDLKNGLANDWIYVAQGGDQWRAFANMVMFFWFR
jgi:hypothetical protein